MTISCTDCGESTTHFWYFNRKPRCGDCAGLRDQEAMRKANEYRLYLDRGELRNASGTFRLAATIMRSGDENSFPTINHIQAVFDHSVWHGIQSWDNVDGAVLLRRTKKKYLPNGEEM